jgi:hypothetical protein
VPALDDVQLRCCGFVQLTTYLAPGNPVKTPFRGFHPFQAFVIFPIRANPWASLCKKMAERRDTHFQNNGLLTCTGKVAGLLDHRLMVQPPGLAQDYVFIVVPDSWTFLDKGLSVSRLGRPELATPSYVINAESAQHAFAITIFLGQSPHAIMNRSRNGNGLLLSPLYCLNSKQ